MQDNKKFQEELKFFKRIEENSKTSKQLTDNVLRNHDYEAIGQRTKIYTDYLDIYVSEFKQKSLIQRIMKSAFFWTILSLLLIMVIVSALSLFFISKKDNITVSDVVIVVTSISGAISSFLILPKVIADNLFPSKEEDHTAEIFEKMFKNDMNIRNIYNAVGDEKIHDTSKLNC